MYLTSDAAAAHADHVLKLVRNLLVGLPQNKSPWLSRGQCGRYDARSPASKGMGRQNRSWEIVILLRAGAKLLLDLSDDARPETRSKTKLTTTHLMSGTSVGSSTRCNMWKLRQWETGKKEWRIDYKKANSSEGKLCSETRVGGLDIRARNPLRSEPSAPVTRPACRLAAWRGFSYFHNPSEIGEVHFRKTDEHSRQEVTSFQGSAAVRQHLAAIAPSRALHLIGGQCHEPAQTEATDPHITGFVKQLDVKQNGSRAVKRGRGLKRRTWPAPYPARDGVSEGKGVDRAVADNM
ncbi:MAG: hypothetical protein BJ554DRAFT_7707 [Olpidium bornovanus]|uniref:Uncharacterized protein n=1 Tax=Olpidium bornovanus TaxID=278681 RepID=A0A8H7ZW23_9FUNG|nr:MAG: hypothetical protein BJ554DRAFT_7707 [Olpidium bornovanus]